MIDTDLGSLKWDHELQWWEGTIQLSAGTSFQLYVFARDIPDRATTREARVAIERLRGLEDACRAYAASQLLAIHNSEWSEGSPISSEEFCGRLIPDSVVVHESGYAEVHFADDDMFWGHSVGVRIRPDGSFQEAVVEG